MYIHIGNNVILRKKQVIGIFDMDNATVSPITRGYLSGEQKAGRVNSVSPLEIPKSFIVYLENGKSRVYFSPLSQSSLMGRMREDLKIENFQFSNAKY